MTLRPADLMSDSFCKKLQQRGYTTWLPWFLCQPFSSLALRCSQIMGQVSLRLFSSVAVTSLAAEVVVTSPIDASSFIEKLMSWSLGGGNRAINTDYSKYFMQRSFSLERNEAGQMVGECMDSNSCQAPKPLQRKAIWAGYSRSSACLSLF